MGRHDAVGYASKPCGLLVTTLMTAGAVGQPAGYLPWLGAVIARWGCCGSVLTCAGLHDRKGLSVRPVKPIRATRRDVPIDLCASWTIAEIPRRIQTRPGRPIPRHTPLTCASATSTSRAAASRRHGLEQGLDGREPWPSRCLRRCRAHPKPQACWGHRSRPR